MIKVSSTPIKAPKMVPKIAAWKLQSPEGRGLLLSGIPGLPPADVVILGAGEVGFNAARAFAGFGAQVTVLDQPGRLAEIDRIFDLPGRIRLIYASPDEIQKAVAYADVFVSAILIPGERAAHVRSVTCVASVVGYAGAVDRVVIDLAVRWTWWIAPITEPTRVVVETGVHDGDQLVLSVDALVPDRGLGGDVGLNAPDAAVVHEEEFRLLLDPPDVHQSRD